jgi:hypothetical protein
MEAVTQNQTGILSNLFCIQQSPLGQGKLIAYLRSVDPSCQFQFVIWGRHDHDRMVVGFTTTYAISAYHH